MEDKLKKVMCLQSLSLTGISDGAVSNGRSYDTDKGKIFVKFNKNPKVSDHSLQQR